MQPTNELLGVRLAHNRLAEGARGIAFDLRASQNEAMRKFSWALHPPFSAPSIISVLTRGASARAFP